MTAKGIDIYTTKRLTILKSLAIKNRLSKLLTGFKDLSGKEIREGDYLINPYFNYCWVVQNKDNSWVATSLWYNDRTEEFEVGMSEELMHIGENFKIKGNIYDL